MGKRHWDWGEKTGLSCHLAEWDARQPVATEQDCLRRWGPTEAHDHEVKIKTVCLVVYFVWLYWDLIDTHDVHLCFTRYKHGLGREMESTRVWFGTLVTWSKRMCELRCTQECDAWKRTEYWVRRGERTLWGWRREKVVRLIDSFHYFPKDWMEKKNDSSRSSKDF